MRKLNSSLLRFCGLAAGEMMTTGRRSSLLLETETSSSSSACFLSSEDAGCESTVLYFAFGSNLNTQRIRLKNPSARYKKSSEPEVRDVRKSSS
jgi:hypothetical protein